MQNETATLDPPYSPKNPARHEMNNQLMKVISMLEIASFQIEQGNPDLDQLKKLLKRIRVSAHAAAKVGLEL